MQNNTQLAATLRSTETKPSAVRRTGSIPAVVYGYGMDSSVPVALPATQFTKLYKNAGMSTLLDLTLDDGAPCTVVVRAVQTDPLIGNIVHADLFAINMDVEMEITVPLTFVGVPPAVKEQGGLLFRQVDEVTIRCLPTHLVHDIAVNLSGLAAIGDNIHGNDLVLPEGVSLVEGHNELIVMIVEPKVQEEEVTTQQSGVEDVQVEKKGKKEEEGVDDTEGSEKKEKGADKKK